MLIYNKTIISISIKINKKKNNNLIIVLLKLYTLIEFMNFYVTKTIF